MSIFQTNQDVSVKDDMVLNESSGTGNVDYAYSPKIDSEMFNEHATLFKQQNQLS